MSNTVNGKNNNLRIILLAFHIPSLKLNSTTAPSIQATNMRSTIFDGESYTVSLQACKNGGVIDVTNI
jgi:hypothetical protein